jgi:hypothetical protein
MKSLYLLTYSIMLLLNDVFMMCYILSYSSYGEVRV